MPRGILVLFAWLALVPSVVVTGEKGATRETYSIPEVAAKLGISRNHAYSLAREAAFPVIRLGRRLVVPRDRFDAWLGGR